MLQTESGKPSSLPCSQRKDSAQTEIDVRAHTTLVSSAGELRSAMPVVSYRPTPAETNLPKSRRKAKGNAGLRSFTSFVQFAKRVEAFDGAGWMKILRSVKSIHVIA